MSTNPHLLIWIVACCLHLTAGAHHLHAQTSEPPSSTTRRGLLVVAHGADSAWNSKVREVAAGVTWAHGPMEVAFLMGSESATSGWDSSVTRLVQRGATAIVAVPLLVSSHSGHFRQIQYYAGLIDSLDPQLLSHSHAHRATPSVPFTVTSALDAAPELQTVIRARWESLPDRDRGASVVLVAHGPNDDAEALLWLANLELAAATLREAGAPAVRTHLLRDDAPAEVRAAAIAEMRESILSLTTVHGDSVVVLPMMISSGTITRVKIPRDLEGLPVRYHPLPLAPHPALSSWISRVATRSPG